MNKIVSKHKYDLEERTFKFSENVISLCKILKQDTITKPIISQLIRSSTSVGANYVEANGASSKKDFANKIFICRKESKETSYWLRILATCFEDKKEQVRILYKESIELTLIFSKISFSARKSV